MVRRCVGLLFDKENISISDAVITPVTAYQFIRNCGNRMSAESPENRIQLVKEIWQTLKDKGMMELSNGLLLLSNTHKQDFITAVFPTSGD